MAPEQKEKKFVRRLDSRNIVRPLVNKLYEEGLKAAEEGRPVAWSMVNWWEGNLVMRAMGVTPVYPENYGAVCASSGISQKYLALSDAEGFPSHLCGYPRNCLGYGAVVNKMGRMPPDAPMGGMPKPDFLLGAEFMCDTRFKWFQALRPYFHIPMWTINSPNYDLTENISSEIHSENIHYKVQEIKRFIAFLEDFTGNRMDLDLLGEYVDNQEKVFQLWWEINEMRKTTPCPMHSRDFWTLMVPNYYLTSDKETVTLYQQVYDEVNTRLENGIGAVEPEKYRLMFNELPPWHSLHFFEKLAERGWNFVIESQGYHPPEPLMIETGSSVLERLVRWTYWFTVGHLIKAKRKNYALCADYSVQGYYNWAKEYRVDGYVAHPLISCRTVTFWLTHTINVLQDMLDIPGFVMEGDIVDFSVFNPEGVLKDAPAFEESMEHFRSIRRQKGLDW